MPDHLLATFRKHYARALAAAAARPGGSWARDGAELAAVRNGRLEAVVAAEDDPLYVPDEHGALKQSLVELAGHPVLVADADDGEAIAAALTAQGVSAVRLSDVTVKVFSADEEIVPGPQRPLLAAGRDWFVTVVALALELKSGTFVRPTERTLRALLSTVRSVRVARVPEVAVVIGGAPAVPADGVRSIPLPDPSDPTVAVWDTHGEWDELQACAPALAQLLAQPYLHDALELALIKLERLLGEEPPDLIGDEALARALDTTAARVAELRRGLEGDVHGVKRLLRPVLAVITDPADRDAADDALTSSGTEAALIGLLVPQEAALGRTAVDVVALLRRAGAVDEARDLLGLDFAAFNEALQWLGRPYAPLTHPDLHEAAMAKFLAGRGEAVIERLRERYRTLVARGEDASGYASGRRFDGLAPDGDWLTACRVPTLEQLQDCVCAWLAGHGAAADLDAPAVLPSVDAMRSAAATRLEDLVGAAAPLVRAWCRKHGVDVPAAWAGTPLLEASFALDESGMADLVELDDARLLAAAAAGAGWPDGMPLAADADELGLAPEDLRRAEDDAATARKASRPATTISVGDQELPVGTDNLARIAEAALASVDPAFLAQSGRTVLAQMAAAGSRQGASGGGRGAVARDRALSEEERSAIGIVGEVAARAWLAHKYRDVKWVSGYAAIVSGARDAFDGHGYDFEVAWRNTTLMFEVKAMRAEPGWLVEFEMGESEVRAAQAAARGDRYRILLVTSVLDPSERRIHRLPNPFSAKGQGLFRVAGRGLRYQFSPS